jgi:hypothetical protein
MAIPLATTTITVTVADTPDLDDEPYAGAGVNPAVTTATGVRAVIDRGTGREQLAGGEQSISDFLLTCDPINLDRRATVTDDTTGIDYRVVWLLTFPGEHTEAGLRLVQGET